MIELLKVKSEKTYKDKNDVERNYYNYFLVLNGIRIAIKPVFKDGYSALKLFAEVK